MKAKKWLEKSARKADYEEFESILKKIDRHSRNMSSLNRQLLLYKDIKDGRVPAVPKPRSYRLWSKDPFLDMLLNEEYERTKNFSEEQFQEDMRLCEIYD